MKNEEMFTTAKNMIINNGVKNLNEFGYSDVTSDNILTDPLYSEMFKRMLNNNKGEDERIDDIIDDILLDIFNNQKVKKEDN